MKTRSHSLHILFPLGLLGMFAALAVVVLLLTAGHYQQSRAQSQAGYHSAAALSYLTEKLRQNDCAGAVTLTTLGDSDALVLTYETADNLYDTYLYCHGGSLRELMVNRSYPADPAMGRTLLPLAELRVEPGPGSTWILTCREETGVSAAVCCALRGEAAS